MWLLDQPRELLVAQLLFCDYRTALSLFRSCKAINVLSTEPFWRQKIEHDHPCAKGRELSGLTYEELARLLSCPTPEMVSSLLLQEVRLGDLLVTICATLKFYDSERNVHLRDKRYPYFPDKERVSRNAQKVWFENDATKLLKDLFLVLHVLLCPMRFDNKRRWSEEQELLDISDLIYGITINDTRITASMFLLLEERDVCPFSTRASR